MSWRINLSGHAEKFLDKNTFTMDEVRQLISKAINYSQGEDLNINIKKLKGEWHGFFSYYERAYSHYCRV